MEKELQYLGHALGAPERPFVAILGGAKVSDKIEVIENLLGKVDALVIGGAMAYTFLKARGLPVGRSLVEDDKLEAARDDHGARARARRAAGAAGRSRRRREARGGRAARRRWRWTTPRSATGWAWTSGPETVGAVPGRSWRARRPWSGTGRWACSRCRRSTRGPTRWRSAVADVKGTTIIGGGDSVSAVTKAGVADRITHISTGGGASLEFLGGRVLPGVAALADK